MAHEQWLNLLDLIMQFPCLIYAWPMEIDNNVMKARKGSVEGGNGGEWGEIWQNGGHL